jgi:predicted RND superfamily exporter protein
MNAYLGMLASIVIGSALFLDFFLLPPFLLLIEKLKNKEKEL